MVDLLIGALQLEDSECGAELATLQAALLSGETMNRLLVAPATALLIMIAGSASAHTGIGDTHGFGHGFTHPIGGLDHVLAMVAVGLFAAHLGGRALWLVPLTFVSIMAVGGAMGMAGIELPYVEAGIAASVLVFGLMVALRLSLHVGIAMVLVGFFAVFHGHAHGVEMPSDASGLSYAIGFMTATAALHAVGILIGIGLSRTGSILSVRASQAAGCIMAFVGVDMLSGLL